LTLERTSRSSLLPPSISLTALSCQDISKDIIDLVVHLLGKGVISSPMEFLLTNFQTESLHRFDTVCASLPSPSLPSPNDARL
jgi:hypothetical protein